MPVPSVKIDESDFNKIQKLLSKLSNHNLQEFLVSVGRRLVNDFRMGFKLGVDPAGKKWAGITHREGQPLKDTGRLQRSIIARVSGKSLEVGTNTVYAKTHQYGDAGSVTIPEHTKLINQAFGKKLKFPVFANVKSHTKQRNIKARPFLGIEQRQRDKIVLAFEHQIKQISNGQASKTQ